MKKLICTISLLGGIFAFAQENPVVKDSTVATKEIQEMLNEKLKPLIMEAIKSKANGEVVLNTIGIEAVGLIQKSINEGIYAPNKESTLKHKKGSKPLIDTGTMLQSVNFKIEGV